MTLGGSLKRREKLSGRLGDILSNLYLASAALKRFEDQGSPQDDLPLLNWVCQYNLYQIQKAFDGLLQNLPNRPVAWVIRWFIFPLGQHFKAPSDKLGHEISTLLLNPSAARDRLTAGLYIPQSTDEQLGRIEAALEKVIKAEPAERRLRRELKSYRPDHTGVEGILAAGLEQRIITEQDAELIREAEAARNDVIQVDDFSPDLT
jgi:acyl-CoA dehydrogenase